MKWPLIGRRPAAPAPAPSAPTVDVSRPRECCYQTIAGQPGPCPRCGSRLHRAYQAYLIGTRRGRQPADSFLMGGDFGWFCPHCPTVVIDQAELGAQLRHATPRWDVGTDVAVLGTVNLDAIPSDKQHLPLGGDDNPIPLVEFTHATDPPVADRFTHQRGPRPDQGRGSTRRKGKKRRAR